MDNWPRWSTIDPVLLVLTFPNPWTKTSLIVSAPVPAATRLPF